MQMLWILIHKTLALNVRFVRYGVIKTFLMSYELRKQGHSRWNQLKHQSSCSNVIRFTGLVALTFKKAFNLNIQDHLILII